MTIAVSARPLQLHFLSSATRASQLPDSDAEVAFVGRSNVGKSSLINALANQKQLARVSNTPGRTQLINIFRHDGGGTLVDLPGYGYAKVPGRVRKDWPEMIEGYLLDREPLEMVFVLVDGEIGPTPLDVQMLDSEISVVRWSPDGKHLAAGEKNGRVTLFDLVPRPVAQ